MTKYINKRHRPFTGSRARRRLCRILEAPRRADVFLHRASEQSFTSDKFAFPFQTENGGGEGHTHLFIPVSSWVQRQIPSQSSFYLTGVRLRFSAQSNAPVRMRIMVGSCEGDSSWGGHMDHADGNPVALSFNTQDAMSEMWGVPWIDENSMMFRNRHERQLTPVGDRIAGGRVVFNRFVNLAKPPHLGGQTAQPWPTEKVFDMYIPFGERMYKNADPATLRNDKNYWIHLWVEPKTLRDGSEMDISYPLPVGGFRTYFKFFQLRYFWKANAGLGFIDDTMTGVTTNANIRNDVGTSQDEEQVFPTATVGYGSFRSADQSMESAPLKMDVESGDTAKKSIIPHPRMHLHIKKEGKKLIFPGGTVLQFNSKGEDRPEPTDKDIPVGKPPPAPEPPMEE